jgi:hypothetical protein
MRAEQLWKTSLARARDRIREFASLHPGGRPDSARRIRRESVATRLRQPMGIGCGVACQGVQSIETAAQ